MRAVNVELIEGGVCVNVGGLRDIGDAKGLQGSSQIVHGLRVRLCTTVHDCEFVRGLVGSVSRSVVSKADAGKKSCMSQAFGKQ